MGNFKKYYIESREILHLAWPLILSLLLSVIIFIIPLMSTGHLGRSYLDSMALATSFYNLFGISVVGGGGYACCTIYAQLFGSKHKEKLGVALQKGISVLFFALCISVALYINSRSFFICFGQIALFASMAEEYLICSIPVLFAALKCQTSYLECQNIVKPCIFISLCGGVFNLTFQFLFIYYLKYSLHGSALACVIGYGVQLIISTSYIKISGVYKATWSGFTIECLDEWGLFLKLLFAGALIKFVQNGSFELGMFIARYNGEVELGSHSVMFYYWDLFYSVSTGIGLGTSIRQGQALGAGEPSSAKISATSGLIIAGINGAVMSILILALAPYMPYMFTSDQQVIERASVLMYVLAFHIFFDNLVVSCEFIMYGMGRQTQCLLITLPVYVLCATLAYFTVSLIGLGIIGFWLIMTGGYMVIFLTLVTLITKSDWEKYSREAQENAACHKRLIDEEEDNDLYVGERKSYLSKNIKRGFPFFMGLLIVSAGLCVRFAIDPLSSSVDLKASVLNGTLLNETLT